jgi:Flp pilus assembly protein TadD
MEGVVVKVRSNCLWVVAVGVWAFSPSTLLDAATNPAAVRINDTTQEIHDRAADALLQGRLFEALRGFDEVLKIEPFNAAAYYNRGNARYLRREFELAVRDFTAALNYKPGFSAAAMNRGVAFSNLNRLEEALADLNSAAELDPSNPDVFFNRTIVHVKRGSLDEALADYEKIVLLDGTNPNVAEARSRLKALLTRVDELALVGRERDRRIIAEIDHARSVEQVLAFTERTCIRLGDDTPALAALAQADGWSSVTEQQLVEASTPTVKLTAGWTVTNRLGSIAIVQSRSVQRPHQMSCSITARLGDPHWFDDFATLFTSKFDSPRLVIMELEGRRVSKQVVVRDDQARVEVTLSQTSENRVFTVGTIHGKEKHAPKR